MSKVSIDILKLNDDCLLEILELLTLKERLKVELVCKRWQSLCHRLWKSTKTLIVGSINVPEYYSFDSINYKIQLESLLKLCTNLEFLNITYDTGIRNNSVLELIAKYCRDSLKSLILEFCGTEITDSGIENFCTKVHSLTEIQLHALRINDKQLESIFNSQPELKYLKLDSVGTLNKPNFNKLNKKIESISINYCLDIDNDNLIIHLNKFNHLKKFSIITDVSLRINKLVKAIPKIEHLTIEFCFRFDTNEVLREAGVLKNLRSLQLDLFDAITDSTIDDIVENCHALEQIDFGRFVNDSPITSEGLKRLSELPKLKKIRMKEMDQINDEVLEMLAMNGKLTHVKISSCHNITDKCISSDKKMSTFATNKNKRL